MMSLLPIRAVVLEVVHVHGHAIEPAGSTTRPAALHDSFASITTPSESVIATALRIDLSTAL